MEVACIKPGKKDSKQFKSFLKELCDMAKDEGAGDARLIPCEELSIRKKVGRKKPNKSKFSGNISIHWPEPEYPNDNLYEALSSFRQAVVFRIDMEVRSKNSLSQINSENIDAYKLVYKISAFLESACFYRGYHLAIGLAAGNCKDLFCATEKRCQAMIKGRGCLYIFRARASIEACGLNLKKLASIAKWNDFGKGNKFIMGMVFVD